MGGRHPGLIVENDKAVRASAVGLHPPRGLWAEEAAAAYLARRGLSILERNWRCPGGELDIIAQDADGTLVFVEVKQRGHARHGALGESITPRKARLLERAARTYLQTDDRMARFDAVLVTGTRERHALEWLRDVL